MRVDTSGYMFFKGNTNAVMEQQRTHLKTEIASMTPNVVMQSDIEDLATELAKKFSIDVPVLDESGITPQEPREVQINISGDPTRRIPNRGVPFYEKGTEIKICVPFSGDAGMFLIRPMQYTNRTPHGEIVAHQLIFSKVGTRLDAAQVRAEFDQWLRDVKQYLDWHRAALGNFNQDLTGVAYQEITQRRNKLSADRNLISGLGFLRKS